MSRAHLVGVVLVVGLVGCRPPSGEPTTGSPRGAEMATAGDVAIPSLQQKGETIKLSSYAGKVVLLDFWATWCPPCKAELPALNRLYGELKEKDFVLIGMTVDQGSLDEVTRAVSPFNLSYPVGLAGPDVQSAYGGIRAVPTKFLVDRQGKIRKTYVGIVEEKVLRGDIDQVLAE